jgi:hypothetical protein
MKIQSLRVLAAAAALCIASAVPMVANAQNQAVIHGVYLNRVSYKNFVHSVERESNSFRHKYEKRYHDMFLPNFRKSDRVRDKIQDLDKAIEVVYKRSLTEKPEYIRDDVAKVIKRAKEVDRLFNDPDRVLSTMRSDWYGLKRNINDLAGIYELSDIDE